MAACGLTTHSNRMAHTETPRARRSTQRILISTYRRYMPNSVAGVHSQRIDVSADSA